MVTVFFVHPNGWSYVHPTKVGWFFFGPSFVGKVAQNVLNLTISIGPLCATNFCWSCSTSERVRGFKVGARHGKIPEQNLVKSSVPAIWGLKKWNFTKLNRLWPTSPSLNSQPMEAVFELTIDHITKGKLALNLPKKSLYIYEGSCGMQAVVDRTESGIRIFPANLQSLIVPRFACLMSAQKFQNNINSPNWWESKRWFTLSKKYRHHLKQIQVGWNHTYCWWFSRRDLTLSPIVAGHVFTIPKKGHQQNCQVNHVSINQPVLPS